MRRLLALCPLLLVSFGAQAKDGATGTVTFSGETWPVADAVAVQEEGDTDIELAFAQLRWDRKAWARDGKFESFDLLDFENDGDGPQLRIEIDPETNAYSGHTFRFSSSSTSGGYDGAFENTVRITSRTDTRISGTVDWPDTKGYAAKITFDLPIVQEGPMARPGTPLPADGGAPGKALRATVEATHAGDVDTLTKLSNPERRAGIEEAKASGELPQMLAMAKLFTPKIRTITGGTQDGDTATVDFVGEEDGGTVKASAEMVRLDGVWYIEGINTSSAD